MRVRALLLATAVGTTVWLTGCGSGEPATPVASQGSTPSAEEAANQAALESAGVDLEDVDWSDKTSSPDVEVDAVDNNFKAQYTEVKAGAKITFRNDGRNEHNVVPVLKGGTPDISTADFQPGTETTITFDKPGDYAYYCSLHGTKTKGMTGAIRVVK